MEKFKSVQDYLNCHPEWENLLNSLREILWTTELEETLKWSIPTYTLQNKNVIGMGAFKQHVAIWFFNGVFLKDEMKILINAQEGVTKGLRQWRFQSIDEIEPDLVKTYIEEAIENQKMGLEVKPEKKPLIIPTELQDAFDKSNKLHTYFEQFTQGKKREFADYISSAKQEGTRLKRLEKIIPMILKQIGLNDKYRS